VGWTFFWLMVVLKIPIIAAIAIVWWAIRAVPEPVTAEEPEAGDDEGGSKVPAAHLPRPRRPKRPRGPHGLPAPPSPPRIRTKVAGRSRART
jgi:hypothetical protein